MIRLTCFGGVIVADDGGGRAMQVCVHVEVILAQVSLHQQLVLLGVPPGQHQVVLAGHKPVELLEPVRLAQLLRRIHRLDLHTPAG